MTSTTQCSKLMELPAELRNQIYREVLVNSNCADGPIIEPNGYDRSAILQTSRQIRNEALRIYYVENLFTFEITNFDATAAMSFYDTCKSIKASGVLRASDVIRYKVHCNFDTNSKSAKFCGNKSPWTGLMEWLEFIHSGKDLFFQFERPYSEKEKKVNEMFRYARNNRAKSWERVAMMMKYEQRYLEDAFGGFLD